MLSPLERAFPELLVFRIEHEDLIGWKVRRIQSTHQENIAVFQLGRRVMGAECGFNPSKGGFTGNGFAHQNRSIRIGILQTKDVKDIFGGPSKRLRYSLRSSGLYRLPGTAPS